MAARAWIWVVPLLAICEAGCSESDVPASSAQQPAHLANLPLAPAVATAVLPAPAATVAPAKPKDSPDFIPPFPENIDMFAPPKAPPPPAKPEPEKIAEAPPVPAPVATPAAPEKKLRPPLRLVGFVNVASPKALLSLHGKLSAVPTGATIQEVEVLAIEPPSVKLKFDNEEYSINLLEQSPEGVRTSMRSTPAFPLPPLPRGTATGPSPAPPVPTPPVPAAPNVAPAPPAPSVAVAAERPPSAPPRPSVETVDPPTLPALPPAAAVNSLRDLPKLP